MATVRRRTPRQHTFVSAGGGAVTQAGGGRATGNSTLLRIIAVVMWLLGIGCEVIAVLAIKRPELLDFLPSTWRMVGALVIDLILVIIGSQCWKKANRISPASRRSPVKFWLWNNLGVIMSVIAFAPFIVLLLTDKNADGKTKRIGTIVAAVALVIAGLTSYDFDPVAQEDIDQVCWAPGGSVYHIYEDCYHLDRTGELVVGSVEEAQAAGKDRLCYTCESNYQSDMEAQGMDTDGLEDLTGRTDGGDLDGEDLLDLDLIPDAA